MGHAWLSHTRHVSNRACHLSSVKCRV